MLALAEHIIDSKAAEFDPAEFHDRYEEAVIAMLRTKQAGKPAETSKTDAAGKSNVIDFIDALKRSIAGTPKPAEVIKAKKPRSKLSQCEMLLQISGSMTAKDAASWPQRPNRHQSRSRDFAA